MLLRPTCSIETLHSASEQRFQASGWFHFCGTEDRKLSGMNCSLLRLILISGCNSHSFLSHIAQCRSSSLSASILAGLGCSFGSVQLLSCVWFSETRWTAARQASLSVTNSRSSPRPMSIEWWCHPTISSSVVPFASCPQSFPASGSFQMSQPFPSGGQSIGVSASTSVLPMSIQDWLPLDGLVGSPCSPRDSQESSPTPQFKSINSSVLSFLYDPTLTSIHDYWKNHSFD